MTKDYFDERIAKNCEIFWPEIFDPRFVASSVSFLVDLAGDGPALELGIGTGRLALPLIERGVRVSGIDLSPAMIAELRKKPRGDEIDVVCGDISTTEVKGSFTLAFIVRNTIMNLTSQDAQVRCFQNASNHLEPGGHLVAEVVVPALRRLPPGETIVPLTVTAAHLGFDEYEVETQISWSHHYWLVEGRLETFSAPFRYVWPSELDLMARLAGMTLLERWSDWDRTPFTSESRSHVSVWEKPG